MRYVLLTGFRKVHRGDLDHVHCVFLITRTLSHDLVFSLMNGWPIPGYTTDEERISNCNGTTKCCVIVSFLLLQVVHCPRLMMVIFQEFIPLTWNEDQGREWRQETYYQCAFLDLCVYPYRPVPSTWPPSDCCYEACVCYLLSWKKLSLTSGKYHEVNLQQ